jgi:hypothetical protein
MTGKDLAQLSGGLRKNPRNANDTLPLVSRVLESRFRLLGARTGRNPGAGECRP